MGAIGDAIREMVVAIVAMFHCRVILSIAQCQLPEQCIVWCWTILAAFEVISRNLCEITKNG